MKKFILLTVAAIAALLLSQNLLRHNQRHLKDMTKVRLVTWNVPPGSLPKERQIWDETVKRFEDSHPDVVVEGYEREYRPEEFIAVMAGGKGPDLVKVWAGAIPTLVSKGFLVSLNPYLDKWDQKYFIDPIYWESVKVGDGVYGVPADTNFLFLLYRKDLFQKAGLNPEGPPANWVELVDAAKVLTRRAQGVYGLGLVPKTWYFQDFVWQAGGEMVRTDADGKTTAAFAEPPAVQALQFWKDLRWKYDVLQPNPLMRETELLHLFALGKVAMIFGTSDQIPALVNRYGLDPNVFGIAPLPAGPARSAAHLGGQVYVLNASDDAAHRQAAWDFVQFEMSPGNQLWKWQRMQELKMVIVPGEFSAAAKIENLPGFQMVQNVMQTAKVEPHVAGWPQVRDLLDSVPLQQVILEPNADPGSLLLSYAKEADRRFLCPTPEAKRK